VIKKASHKIKDVLLAKNLIRKVKYSQTLQEKKIVFFTIRPFPVVLHQELFLGYQLAAMGAQVYIVLDDGLFCHWDQVQQHANTQIYTYFSKVTLSNIIKLALSRLIKWSYKHKNIKFIYLSEMNLEENKINNFALATSLDKQQAESSVRRFFETGEMDLNLELHQDYYEQSLMNCLVSKYAAINLVQTLSPNLYITSHGIYSVWGPAYNYMVSKNVPSLIYGAHSYKSREILICDVIAQKLASDSGWQNFNNTFSMSELEYEMVCEYFEHRINFKENDTRMYYGHYKSFKEIKLKREKNLKNYCLFPNVIWDGDVYERNTIFKGVLDWILQTIRLFRNCPHRLIIRFHPAETTIWKNSKSLEGIIREKIHDIDSISNLFLISSDTPLNTYKFIAENVDGMFSSLHLGKINK
jgi:hypothetical protein